MDRTDQHAKPVPISARRRITSYDIAAKAGVSQPTVSRALRGSAQVNPATRDAIMQIARDLGYTVDQNAARLRMNSTETLALVILCEFGEDRASLNPFYYELIGCIEAEAADMGYALLISFQDTSDKFFGQYEDSRRADGVIVIGSARNKDAWDYFRDVNSDDRAIICWGAPGGDLVAVCSDNEMGGVIATEHMIQRGRRQIAFLGPAASGHRQFAGRRLGYEKTLARYGLVPVPVPTVDIATREEFGLECVLRLLDAGVEFDGIFASSDLIALGALSGLGRRGIAVPDRVSVVGFDGIRSSAFSSPPLTTVTQNVHLAARTLVRGLTDMIAGRPVTMENLPVGLCVRESS